MSTRDDCPRLLQVPLRLVRTEWDLLNWGYIQTWQAKLPPYPNGTIVRYTVEAEDELGGGLIKADDGAVYSYYVGDPGPPAWMKEPVEECR